VNLGRDVFDNIDIRNTLKDVLKNVDWTDGDVIRQRKKAILLAKLYEISFPRNMNIKYYVKKHWFQSMWSFACIQRVVEQFLNKYAMLRHEWKAFSKDKDNNREPLLKRPPKVSNFTVVPLSDYHLKHTRLDFTNCYELTSSRKALPSFYNEKTKRQNRYSKEFYKNHESELWNRMFKMDEIRKLEKNRKEFYFQLLTDGVSVSLLFTKKPKKQFSLPDELKEICEKRKAGDFIFELAIDPNDKTWLAGVRYNIATQVEVSKHIHTYINKCGFE